VPYLAGVVRGTLPEEQLDWDTRSSLCVVIAAGGYPGKHDRGQVISGLEEVTAMEDVVVFHGGTALEDDRLVVAGAGFWA